MEKYSADLHKCFAETNLEQDFGSLNLRPTLAGKDTLLK